MRSKMYDKIKGYYDSGLWNETRVRNMVLKGKITDEEYTLITNKEYDQHES